MHERRRPAGNGEQADRRQHHEGKLPHRARLDRAHDQGLRAGAGAERGRHPLGLHAGSAASATCPRRLQRLRHEGAAGIPHVSLAGASREGVGPPFLAPACRADRQVAATPYRRGCVRGLQRRGEFVCGAQVRRAPRPTLRYGLRHGPVYRVRTLYRKLRCSIGGEFHLHRWRLRVGVHQRDQRHSSGFHRKRRQKRANDQVSRSAIGIPAAHPKKATGRSGNAAVVTDPSAKARLQFLVVDAHGADCSLWQLLMLQRRHRL
mmetsp:Transcript_119061/g.342109  ORF Transcript_119061/g.342109 Transcript_119061/m.342109 type:complete len:262 (+) Transcript_119061:459-1244(+)